MPLNIPRVAEYARFSSDNQRSESIDAQLRAMNQFCKQNHWQVVAIYTDEARSATTDNRPEFQKMIADSSKGIFDIVLVHKLDRFSRDRYDSAIYKKRLKKNHVTLCSVLEKMDDSPESIMMESVLEGMAEYYSKNLAREVMKGMNETALQCKHTGGSTPLGFDLDHEKHLVINPHEAEAVKIIFEMYDNGYGYSDIITTLNQNGYTTKKGCTFGKNSLYEILGNEKYTGTFVFNRLSSSEDGKRTAFQQVTKS
jgi:site-specific DNA recombinase